VLVLAGASACGGVGLSGLLQPAGPDAAEAPAETAANVEADASGGASWADDDAAFGANAEAAASASSDAAMPAATDASFDGSLDEGGGVAPTPQDAGADGRIETEGDTPCSALLQCCGRLVLVGPLAAACYLSAEAADGGNAGTCGSTLASFQDSGLCP
jgi:hypothetical protein